MPAIYPSTALKNQQREIKSKADNEIVHITENGWGKYVFMSEEVFQHAVDQAVQDAIYEQRMTDALRESRHDFYEGLYYSSREDLLAAVAKKREAINA
ncbi:sodium:proline symporter [Adlercreutzia sp. ZJ304]|uniref:sodium:proline symporter n=1 Tax=Adlercreutzia sp. ZJ304 TaxID=2709791 RepID=UPI0013E9F979|nr:sodium:proline symporter [Adlercreutzia sp. ZJ304]